MNPPTPTKTSIVELEAKVAKLETEIASGELNIAQASNRRGRITSARRQLGELREFVTNLDAKPAAAASTNGNGHAEKASKTSAKETVNAEFLRQELAVLHAIPADEKFPVTVDKVRAISVKKVRDPEHLATLIARCERALAKTEAKIAK